MMYIFILSKALLLQSIFSCRAAGVFETKLKYYETLEPTSFQRRLVRRDAHNARVRDLIVDFQSFGKHFSLHLSRNTSIISSDFSVLIFDEFNHSQKTDVELNLFSGYIEDEFDSAVSAYFSRDERHILSAHIDTHSEVYFIEPLEAVASNSSEYTMIIYRQSDLINLSANGTGSQTHCGVEDDDVSPRILNSTFDHDDHLHVEHERLKRNTDCLPLKHKTCRLILVADILYYEFMGHSDIYITVHNLVIRIIDDIYQQQTFNCYTGFGFEIARIVIVKKDYKAEGEKKGNDLLQKFIGDGELFSFHSYCLAHLFTCQEILYPNVGYMLGLSKLGPPYSTDFMLGDICCKEMNCGFTTYMGEGSQRIPSLQAYLVTAHGHGWGSGHDRAACIPDDERGLYLMNEVSVNGFMPNNYFFSPCSLNAVTKVLMARSQECFTDRKPSECGNYYKDPGEDCDDGTQLYGLTSQCCTSDCKLISTAQCSAYNDECCSSSCLFADVICRPPSNDSCYLHAHCQHSATCLAPVNKPDGTQCQVIGICQSGKCVTVCEQHGMKPCTCRNERNNGTDLCKLCCFKKGKSCHPLTTSQGETITLADGWPCKIGACYKGVCKHQLAMVAKSWDIFNFTGGEEIDDAIQSNIVVFVLLLSLVVCIPAFIIIKYFDVKRERHLWQDDAPSQN